MRKINNGETVTEGPVAPAAGHDDGALDQPTWWRRKRLKSLAVGVSLSLLLTGLFVYPGPLGSDTTRFARSLADTAPPARSQVVMADGEVVANFFTENRVPVRLNQIAPVMRQAIVATEDRRFYEHGAMDLKGTLRALLNNARGNAVQGGSTLTQQYVKMSLISACDGDTLCVEQAQGSNVGRKIRELRYAVAVESEHTKDEILEGYLNLAYFGDGAYGVEAAAEHYFSTSAAQLNLSQAAMLAGLVQAPTSTDPVAHPDAALARRDVVLATMSKQNVVTPQQAAKAAATDFSHNKVTAIRSGCLGTDYPNVCDYVRRTLIQDPALGPTEKDRARNLYGGGLTIRTTIDPSTQKQTQSRIADVVGASDPVISTMDMIEPGTGRILAMAQSRPVMGADQKAGQTYWNYSATPDLGGSTGFQAGSTFKAFTAAAALEQGVPLTDKRDSPRSTNYRGRSFDNCSGREQIRDDWTVKSTPRADGEIDMYEAAALSANNYFVPLELDLGLCRVTQLAQRLGITPADGGDLVERYQHVPAFTLGAVEIAPLSLAEAYATFAARGIHCRPIIIDSISAADGTTIAPPDAQCQRVLKASVADSVNALLAYVMTDGTGAKATTGDERPQAGKTGTIENNRALWFAGYTPEVAGVAMISVDNQRVPFTPGEDGKLAPRGLKGYRIPSSGVRLRGTGSTDAGRRLWKPAMEDYLRNVPATSFVDPPQNLVGEPDD